MRDAKAELDRLSRKPDSAAVRLRRAYVLLSTGSSERATRELNRLVADHPRPVPAVGAQAHYLLALAYEARGNHDRAQLERDRARQLNSDPELERRLSNTRVAVTIPAEQPVPSARVAGAQTAALNRRAWQAAQPSPSRMIPLGRVEKITIHHSAILARSESDAHAAAAIRSIQKNHMQGNGWGDIGYHFVIDRAGRVWHGRDLRWQGAHAGDPVRNKGNIGVCLLGNFVASPGGQSPSPAQLGSLEALLASMCEQHRLPGSAVLTHRELRSTTCPGEQLQVAVERIRRQLGGVAKAPSALPLTGG